MNKKILGVAAACLLVFAVAACRTATVYNVDKASFSAQKATSMDDVEKAIMRAGAGLGWQLRKEADGHMVGTLALRNHVAVVDIVYNTSNFSIRYKDSTNLGYDGSNIHSNYNGWVMNLEKAINTQIALI